MASRSLKLSKNLREKNDETKLSVLPFIDKAVKKRTKFSLEALKKSIKDLDRYISLNSEVDDDFMFLFFKLYDQVYSDRPRSQKVFHPSSIKYDCTRRLYYEFSGVEPTDYAESSDEIKPQTQRTFDCGTWWHTYIQMLLWKAGVLEQSEVVIANKEKRINGRTDGIIRIANLKIVLEIKSIGSFQFDEAKLRPLIAHQAQAGVYATEYGAELICFLYVNKDTSEIAEHIIPVNKMVVKEAYEIIDFVLEAVKDGMLPRRIVCKSSLDSRAKKCEYCTKCFTDPKK
jgi:hypothetical protein